MRFLILFLVIISIGFSQKSIQITYLANEGVLIESSNIMIMLDGLFRHGVAYGYERIPNDEWKKLESAVAPYNKETILLVSHPHADHFNAKSVALHLKNNSKSKLYSSAQVIEAVSEYLEKKHIDSQLVEVTPELKKSESIQFNKWSIDFLRLRHGTTRNYKIHNLGHVININGTKILHIGDAEMSDENFEQFRLVEQSINIALQGKGCAT